MSNLTAILMRVFDPQNGGMTPELAPHVLKWKFAPADLARYEELVAKSKGAGLTADEQAEIEEYLTANDILAVLKSKARSALHQHTPAA